MGYLFDTKHEVPYVNECKVCQSTFESHSDDPDVQTCPECGAKGEDGFIVSGTNVTIKRV